MKKITLALSLLIAVSAVSCKKDEKTSSTASSTWTVDGTKYTSVSATKNDNAYAFAAASGASLSFFFKAYPTASGTYKINTDATVDADEVTILLGTTSPLMVGGPTDAGGTVNVSVSGGKVSIKCSGIAIDKEDGAGGSLGTGTLSSDVTIDM